MIRSSVGLPAPVLAQIADLERRVVEADGGRLKLGWSSLRSRPPDVAADVLVHEDGGLVGFVGVYRHGAEPELVGMIDPAYRRQGLGTAALAAALQLVRHDPAVLVVVPRPSVGGRCLALRHGAVFHHAEHALTQRLAPPVGDEPEGLQVRPATDDDRNVVARLLLDGFGDAGGQPGGGSRLDHTVVAERNGQVVAMVVVERQDAEAGVYGFVVDPELRGRGIGRAVLARVCGELRADGVREVSLEVEVDNDQALGLYTSLGFEPVTTEDYYRLAAVS